MIYPLDNWEGWVNVDPSPLKDGSVYLEVYRPESGFSEERIDLPLTLRLTGIDREYNQPRTYIRVIVTGYNLEANTFEIEINKEKYTVAGENVLGMEP